MASPRSVSNQPFSQDLQKWLDSSAPKTIASLGQVFAEKSFAVIFLVLMALPALPLPTAGITHIFEIIVMLLALEMVIGRRTLWLPRRWREKSLSPLIIKKGIPFLIKKVRRLEHFSRPRLGNMLTHPLSNSLIGLLVITFSLAAFVSPPFSGLDTIPALGVVFIALGVILEDIVGVIVGTIVGAIGVAILIGLGSGIYHLVF